VVYWSNAIDKNDMSAGWTVIGWVVALAWAIGEGKDTPVKE